MIKVFRNMRARDWGWLHFKFAMAVWALLTLAAQPESINTAVANALVIVWFGLTMTGGVLSMVGIVMAAQPGRCSVIGISIELVGLILLFVGPFLFLVLFVARGMMADDWKWSGIGLTYALSAAMLARVIMVLPRYLREAHDPTKEP